MAVGVLRVSELRRPAVLTHRPLSPYPSLQQFVRITVEAARPGAASPQLQRRTIMRHRRFLRMQLEVVEDRLVPSSAPAVVPHPAGYDSAIVRIDSTHETATLPGIRIDSCAANDRISILSATLAGSDPNPDPFVPARPTPAATIHLTLQSVSLVEEAEHRIASRDRTVDLPPIQESPAIIRSHLLSTPITPHHTEVLAFSHVPTLDSAPVSARMGFGDRFEVVAEGQVASRIGPACPYSAGDSRRDRVRNRPAKRRRGRRGSGTAARCDRLAVPGRCADSRSRGLEPGGAGAKCLGPFGGIDGFGHCRSAGRSRTLSVGERRGPRGGHDGGRRRATAPAATSIASSSAPIPSRRPVRNPSEMSPSVSAEAESGTPPFEPLNPTADPSALDSLYRAYTPYLRAIVRRNLSDRLQGKFDSMDVVHSVWARVVRELGEDGWRVENEEQLRGLLATIARRRVASRARRPEALGELPDGDWERLPEERRSRPSEVAQANELWERMLTLCPPEHRAHSGTAPPGVASGGNRRAHRASRGERSPRAPATGPRPRARQSAAAPRSP